MNTLPRLLGMSLFVVLAVLVGVLTVAIWPRKPAPAATPAVASAVATGAAAPHAARLAALSQKVAFTLASASLALAAALVFTQAFRPALRDTRPPFAAAQREFGTLARLAENSAAQGEALNRERDSRLRAEEDAQLRMDLLSQSLDEKIRLGRDLHDGIIQSLYAVGLTVETVRPLVRKNPDEAERKLEEIRSSLNGAIRDVRRYIVGLAPENLRKSSFSRGVSALFEQLRAERQAAFEIKVDDDAATLLTIEQNVEALQIAREAISNALRHGGASHITLRMHKGEQEVCLLIQDNGRGFDVRHDRSGHGLANMQARAARLGATFRVTSQPGQGARVIANFPLQPSPV